MQVEKDQITLFAKNNNNEYDVEQKGLLSMSVDQQSEQKKVPLVVLGASQQRLQRTTGTTQLKPLKGI